MIYYATAFYHKSSLVFPCWQGGGGYPQFASCSGIDGWSVYAPNNAYTRVSHFIKDDRSSLTEVYMALRYRPVADKNYSFAIATLYDSSSWLPCAHLFRDAGGNRYLHVNRMDGNNYVGIGADATSTPLNPGVTYTIEWYYKMADSPDGATKVWVNGNLIIDVSGVDTKSSSSNSFNMWMLGPCTDSYSMEMSGYHGELILADEQIHNPYTQRKRIVALWPAGSGSNSDFSGEYSDVNSVPADDTKAITTNAVDQVHTFAMDQMAVSPETIDFVSLHTRQMAQGLPTPRNIQPAISLNGTEYVGDSKGIPVLKPWYGRKTWAQNPNTEAPWEIEDIDGLEAGVKSVT